MKCSFDSVQYKGAAMGMFHCPECGEMVLAGVDHPDYSLIDETDPISELTFTFNIKIYPFNEMVIQCDEFPEAISQGTNIIETLSNGVDALDEVLAGRKNRGEKLPYESNT